MTRSVGLTWSQIVPRDTGEAQLNVIGKGDKTRCILIPADLAAALRELRADAPASERVFPSRSAGSTTS